MIPPVLQVDRRQALPIAMVLVVSIPCLVEIHRHRQVDLHLLLAADISSMTFLDEVHQLHLGAHHHPLGHVNPKFIPVYLEVIHLRLHVGPRQRPEGALVGTMLGQQMR